MKFDEPEIIDPDEDWGRRRANMRHEVAVPAVITDRLGITLRCEVDDISTTGMALSIETIPQLAGREPFEQGSLAILAFAPDANGRPEDSVKIKVRIMWRAPVALGVRFEEHTRQLHAALRTIAEAAVTERVMASTGRAHMSREQRQILQACRKTLQGQLPNLLWVMRTDLVNRLRASGDGVANAESQAARDDADTIEDKAMAITRTVEIEFLKNFSEVSDLEQTQELTMMQLQAARRKENENALDVMQARASEQSVRITAIAHTIEERYKAKFFELNVRLANVLGHQLDREANPLVPSSACRLIWQAMMLYCDSQRMQKHLQQTMLQKVSPLIGDLYDALNQTLDEHGAKRIFDVRQDALRNPEK